MTTQIVRNMTTGKTTRVRWFLVFWLFVLSAVSYLDRVNISIAGGAIADAYRLTDVQLGKVFSALVAEAASSSDGSPKSSRLGGATGCGSGTDISGISLLF